MTRSALYALLACLSGAALVAVAAAQIGLVQSGRHPPVLPVLREAGSLLPIDQRSDLGWTIVSRVELRPIGSRAADIPASLVFASLVERCSFARIVRADFTRIVRQPEITDQAALLDGGYQGGALVAGVRLPAGRYPRVVIEHATRAIAWNLIVDEPRALTAPWPEAPWSREIALCLEPQLFVESDADEIRTLVDRWTNRRPMNAAPYQLAKLLAGRVLDHMSEVSTTNLRPDGFAVSGAISAARSGRGTGLDLACLLCAVFRAAGLPSRIVVCADVPTGLASPQVEARAVVEFFLPPQVAPDRAPSGDAVTERSGVWIPVDIQSQRESSSRAPPVDQPWPHFGSGNRLETLVPLAFHFHPPVESNRVGAPAMWSWSPGARESEWRQSFALTQNEAAIQPGAGDPRFFPR